MSTSILPDSAPTGKSGDFAIPQTNLNQLKKQIEQTEQCIASLRIWQTHLESWRAQAKPVLEFERAYQTIQQANLTTWVEGLGLDELRIAVGQNPVLPAWVGITEQTITALEAWLACLKQWQSGEIVSSPEGCIEPLGELLINEQVVQS
ncbi:hypothetical protein QUF63_16350 [Anaerolineales bacterium HSG25]|nr:hypothetical protein [Anaerolineales bacterium HSG25]